MPIYSYLREDGVWVDKIFPITNIPDEIVDNGLKAKRGFKPGSSFNVIWGKGGPPSATLKAQNERRRRDNINAGKRGAAEWRERMPKLMK